MFVYMFVDNDRVYGMNNNNLVPLHIRISWITFCENGITNINNPVHEHNHIRSLEPEVLCDIGGQETRTFDAPLVG